MIVAITHGFERKSKKKLNQSFFFLAWIDLNYNELKIVYQPDKILFNLIQILFNFIQFYLKKLKSLQI